MGFFFPSTIIAFKIGPDKEIGTNSRNREGKEKRPQLPTESSQDARRDHIRRAKRKGRGVE